MLSLLGKVLNTAGATQSYSFERTTPTLDKAKKLEDNVCFALATDRDNSLNIERVRKFVRKARDYKVVYHEFFQAKNTARAGEHPEKLDHNLLKHHYTIIEKQAKELKAHRCALDTDFKFIRES